MESRRLMAQRVALRVPAAALLALLVGTAFALVAESQQLGYDDRPAVRLFADFIAGWAFMLTGAIAWARRPGNRIGPLLLAIGFTWFVGTFGRSHDVLVGHLGRSFQGFYEPLLGALILAYPTGRLARRIERLAVGGWLGAQATWAVSQLTLLRPLPWYDCPACPATADRFVADRLLLEDIAPITLALSVGFAAGVVALAARRIVGAGPAGRRRLVPVGLAAIAVAIGIVTTNGARLTVAPTLYVDSGVVAATYAIDMLAAVAVLLGLLQDRLARTAVADLVVDLSGEPSGTLDLPRLRAALARALGDPTLELFAWDRAAGTYRGPAGEPTAPPEAGSRRAVTRIDGADAPIAAIAHDPSLLDDPGLISAVTAAIRLEADNRTLAGEVERQLEELQASRARIVTAGDAERRRVERDLHDGAQQRLISLSMELGRLRNAASQGGDPELLGTLNQLSGELDAAIEELRELARGILPPILTDAGLGAAVESLAMRAPLPVEAKVELAVRLPAAIESTVYFVIAEGLANVARHANATRATVHVAARDGRVAIEVADDGAGGAVAGGGSGLQGLADRVGALGGTLEIDSRPGRGTLLRAELPVTS